MKRFIVAFVASAMTIISLVGCSHNHLAAKVACGTKATEWYSAKHGRTYIKEVAKTLEAVGKADRSAAKSHFSANSVNGIRTTTKAMLAAVQTLNHNLPPACVPNLDPDVHAGLIYFGRAGYNELASANAAQAKNFNAVQSDLTKAAAQFRAGGRKFVSAEHDLKNYVR